MGLSWLSWWYYFVARGVSSGVSGWHIICGGLFGSIYALRRYRIGRSWMTVIHGVGEAFCNGNFHLVKSEGPRPATVHTLLTITTSTVVNNVCRRVHTSQPLDCFDFALGRFLCHRRSGSCL